MMTRSEVHVNGEWDEGEGIVRATVEWGGDVEENEAWEGT